MSPASPLARPADGRREPVDFDAFYKDTRDRLLLQTWALTGDLAAARSAVRHTYVVAWHHWRKVGRTPDPEAWARPHAWSYALHRHTARLGHRDKHLDAGVKATLDALGKLPVDQRKVLLLTQLAAVTLDDVAREVAMPREDAERALQTATAQFALQRDVQTTDIGALLEPLATAVAEVRWPRASIVRRSGSARRRTHTTVGVLAVVAATVVSGVVVSEGAGVRTTLDREPVAAAAAEGTTTPQEAAPEPPLSTDALLSAAQVDAAAKGRRWVVGRTDGNTEGDGLVVPCQADRYADPRGSAALVRTFSARGDGPRRTAAQLAEVSRTERAARRTYRRSLAWFAGCGEPRVQLLSTRRVSGVGDQAMLLALRSWERPVRTMVVGVARTGLVTTTTALRVTTGARPDVRGGTRLLADAVSGLCRMPDGGACSGTAKPALVGPVPVGEVPSLLSEIDLPPVRRVDRPWTGTPAVRAHQNPASTPCDRTAFTGGGMTHNVTRTFFVLRARLPDEFGLSETAGSLPQRRAVAFVDTVRRKLGRCADDDLTTEVSRVAHTDTRRQDLSVWTVTTEVSEDVTVRYLMAIVRRGTAVAQVGFVPAGERTMSDADFVAVARRALERLREQPAP